MWAWWDFSYPIGAKPSGILYGIPDVLFDFTELRGLVWSTGDVNALRLPVLL
jgi:hypothetical protein